MEFAGNIFVKPIPMDAPFIYEKYVTGKHFLGRKTDCTVLANLLRQGEHVALYDAPKSGKQSLVQQVLFNLRIEGQTFQAGQFSLQNIRTPEQFLLRLGATLIRMSATTPAEYAALVQQYLGGTHFVFDPERFAEADEVLSLSWEIDEADREAMLRFPWQLARERGQHYILILDQWQDILLLDEPDGILRPLEKIVQGETGQGLSLIFMGDRVNAMKSIFEGERCWLHRRVSLLRLSEVDEREIVEYMVKGFLSGGKVVDRDLLIGACRLFQNRLWYLNHFAAILDAKSKGYITEVMLVESLDAILAIHEPRFCAMMDDLTTHQVNFLRAVVDGKTQFSSARVVREYALNSSANVKRVKDALMKKEVLSFQAEDEPHFLDPLFEYWVRKYYFEKPE